VKEDGDAFTLCPSIYVDHTVIRTGYARHDVREAQVIVERERRRDPEQLRVEQAQVAEAVEGADLVMRLALRQDPDRQVDLVRIELPQHAAVVEGAQPEADAGRLASQEGQQPGDEIRLDAARHREGETALDRGRIEGILAEDDALELADRRPDGLDQGDRPRGQPHAVRGPRQQLVAEQLPQSAEAAAHGRLADVQVARRTGDAALGQERVEGHEQVRSIPARSRCLTVMVARAHRQGRPSRHAATARGTPRRCAQAPPARHRPAPGPTGPAAAC